jgi:hypothetical protein
VASFSYNCLLHSLRFAYVSASHHTVQVVDCRFTHTQHNFLSLIFISPLLSLNAIEIFVIALWFYSLSVIQFNSILFTKTLIYYMIFFIFSVFFLLPFSTFFPHFCDHGEDSWTRFFLFCWEILFLQSHRILLFLPILLFLQRKQLNICIFVPVQRIELFNS